MHKDDTDMVVCLREARARGYHRFFIAGCLGGRVCHTLANVQCAYDAALRGEEIWLCDETNMTTVLLPGTYTLQPPMDRFFSLLSYTPQVTGITLTGTEWPLEDAVLDNRFPLGVSNKVVSTPVTLSFRTGALVLVYAMD
ncbi:MAG: thiamine diphosphokinase [Clostridia bacterium]|nr:thiamine diphosphokinase [Clostridia bacterium]